MELPYVSLWIDLSMYNCCKNSPAESNGPENEWHLNVAPTPGRLLNYNFPLQY